MSETLARSPSLADTVANRLRREIGEDKYKSGEKLPTERELSETYGVSRAIIREALGRLKQDGLVRSRQGSGAFVAEGSIPVFRLSVVDLRDASEIQNVVELLVAFESAASALAATRRTRAQLAAITAQFDAMERAIAEDRSGVDEDVAFHRAIIEATANPVFRDMFDFLDTRVRGFIGVARSNSARRSLTRQVQDEHRAILDAIKQKDAEAARSAAAKHLQNAIKRLTQARIGL
jgi:GntR family transcriptional regulator, transcriptional repressor for pyruvate dehydrogenase complex